MIWGGEIEMQILVAGAGIVGISTAIWLQRAGHDVVVVDRAGPASGTSHGNAGVLAAGAVVPVTTPGLAFKAPSMLLDRDALPDAVQLRKASPQGACGNDPNQYVIYCRLN